MKQIVAALAFVSTTVFGAEPDALSNLMGIAQAAVSSPAAKSLAGSVVPTGLSVIPAGTVIQGGKVVSGTMPMALVCKKFQQPNACAEDGTAVPFDKYIIQKTGETSFVIERLEVNTNQGGTAMSVTIHFKLAQ